MSGKAKSSDETKLMPPYGAYKTFVAFIEGLRKHELPSRIDRSVMSSLSGSAQSGLQSALAYFKLVLESGQPTERLRDLVKADTLPERRKILKTMVEEGYPYIFAGEIDVMTATTKQVEELFAKQGASGETVRKALAFFLAMVKQADVKISPHIKPSARPRGNNKARKAAGGQTVDPPPIKPPSTSTASAVSKLIEFKHGGTLTLSVDVNIIEMDEGDRRWMFDLIDQLQAYQKSSQQSRENNPVEGAPTMTEVSGDA